MIPIFQAENLRIQAHQKHGAQTIVDGISFAIYESEVLAIVGEPGCGKTTVAQACVSRLPYGLSISSGKISAFHPGKDGVLLNVALEQSLDPNQTILGFAHTLLSHHFEGIRTNGPPAVLRQSMESLECDLGILTQRPASVSSIDCIKASLAITLSVRPRIIIADNLLARMPAELHDETLRVFRKIAALEKSPAILWLCGNPKELEDFAHRASVLFGGEFIESGTSEQILSDPRHPFTRMLVARTQPAQHHVRGPDPKVQLNGCRFAYRCPIAGPECAHAKQIVRTVAERDVKCMYVQ